MGAARRGKAAPRPPRKPRAANVERLRIDGPADRVAAEALALEIRQLVRRLGVEVTSIRVEPAGLDAASEESGAG